MSTSIFYEYLIAWCLSKESTYTSSFFISGLLFIYYYGSTSFNISGLSGIYYSSSN